MNDEMSGVIFGAKGCKEEFIPAWTSSSVRILTGVVVLSKE